jgi:Transcriptional regulator
MGREIRMDLLQLKYFQIVAKLEHMTKAARELQIAQPALSVTIARLEEDLGVPLFNRIGRNIVLNEYGKAFLKKANKALTELEEGRQELADLAGSEYGFVAVTSTALNKIFCNILGSFVRLYPKINFRLMQIADDDTKLRLLETGEVDFSFINKPVKQLGIARVPLMAEEIFLAVSPEHRFANRSSVFLSELAEERFINLKTNHSLRELYDRLCKKANFVPNIVCECDAPIGMVNLVSAGLGVAFILSSKEEQQDLPVVLIKVVDFDYQSVLQLIWKEKQYLSKAAIHFREYVIQYFTNKIAVKCEPIPKTQRPCKA